MKKAVNGFPYIVYSDGRVFSLKRKLFLKPVKKGGYLSVILYNEGKRRQVYVHRLVVETFKKKPKTKTQVNHIDGDKTNNDIKNLEWVSPLENTRHAIRTGLYNNTGKNNGRAKLLPRHVKAIRALKGVLTHREIADLFCIGTTAISDILNRKSWSHL